MLQYARFSEGGASRVQLTETNHTIASLDASSMAKGRLWDSLFLVEHFPSLSVIVGIVPLSHVHRGHLLIVERILSGSRSGKPARRGIGWYF